MFPFSKKTEKVMSSYKTKSHKNRRKNKIWDEIQMACSVTSCCFISNRKLEIIENFWKLLLNIKVYAFWEKIRDFLGNNV